VRTSKPEVTLPSRGRATRHRTTAERVVHALSWRLEALRGRIEERTPSFLPVLGELRESTGRGTVELARDLVDAWRVFGIKPRDYAALMLQEVPRERWRDFIVDEDLTRFMNKTLDPEDRLLSRDKAAFGEFDRKRGLPWLPTLAVIGRREGPAIEGAAVVEREDQLWPLLRELGETRDLALKPSCGQRGSGFFRVSSRGEIRAADGDVITRETLARATFGYTHRLGDFGYLVQEALSPHQDIIELTGVDALTSVRVVTGLKDGVPHVLESFLKIPGPGRLTDNFRDGETGTLIVGFDPTTGRLTPSVGLLRPGYRHVLERTSVAPVTGRRTEGAELPRWKEAVDIAFRAALVHPRTATMGWDVALAASGWFILDGNPNWGPGWQPCSKTGSRPVLAALYPDDFR
jgi:hypothetical protein